ncbi:LysR family transcriptional regulator [Nonomuraea dietziae]|uniref:LysR family transcriptional regulator n=1 Tax=Nonomuraea dietziae TaxID=65515 RepID=UPI0033D59FE7
MIDFEVRELRYFRAVAEELNFSRAAERLGMAQPPLSRAIRQLERRLGVQLFERTTHHVTLTVAGLTLFDEAGRALDAMSAAARRTRRAALTTPTLVVTAKAGVATDLLRRIVEAYGELPDAPRVEIAVSGYGEQADMLRDGRADLALLGSPFDRRGLDIEPLISEPRVAALPSGHELAHRTALSCRDLAGLPMPQCPGSTASERDYWAGRDCDASQANESAERRPDVPVSGPVVHDSSQLLEAVALGQAVALIPTSLAERNLRDDVAYRPVPDASPYSIAIAWRDCTRAYWTARLVRTAVELTAGQDGGKLAEIA